MMLADGGIVIVWVVGVLLIGFAGFFIVLLAALGRLLRGAWRAATWPFSCGRHASPNLPPTPRTCRQPRCGHINPPDARYCGRCGDALGPRVYGGGHG